MRGSLAGERARSKGSLTQCARSRSVAKGRKHGLRTEIRDRESVKATWVQTCPVCVETGGRQNVGVTAGTRYVIRAETVWAWVGRDGVAPA